MVVTIAALKNIEASAVINLAFPIFIMEANHIGFNPPRPGIDALAMGMSGSSIGARALLKGKCLNVAHFEIIAALMRLVGERFQQLCLIER